MYIIYRERENYNVIDENCLPSGISPETACLYKAYPSITSSGVNLLSCIMICAADLNSDYNTYYKINE